MKSLLLFSIISLLLTYSCNYSSDNANEGKNSGGEGKINIDSLNIPKKQSDFKAYFDSLHKYHSFNGNVLIAQEGIIVYQDSFGMADFKKKEPLTLDHSFQLASVSKQFTAVSVLQLVEKGKIHLDDSIQVYIPKFPYHGITIHMLLCHRSGLTNYTYFMDRIFENKDKPLYNDIVVDSMISLAPECYYPPDITFEYSNTGYMLLAYIVEKVSGVKFYDYVKRNIFDRLGMKRSFFNIYTLDSVKIAKGHLYGTKEATTNLIDGVLGDKGIYTSVKDMLLWDNALYTENIISKKYIELAFSRHGKSVDENENYGYGWRLYKADSGFEVVYHGGWWRGFQNLYIHVPEKKWCIIVLSNRKTRHYIPHQELFKILMQ